MQSLQAKILIQKFRDNITAASHETHEKLSLMEIILFRPEIPQNTGNVVRTCSATNTKLTLVKPLGFSISDKTLKRAGLDYWSSADIHTIDNLESYLLSSLRPFYFFSSKATKSYTDVKYSKDSILIFGSEISGFPKEFFEKWSDHFLKLPMAHHARCLNLSNTVAIAIYEGLRQQGFDFTT